MAKISIHARLRELRELSGLSARALSKAAGLNERHVAMIEDGTVKDPASSTIEALAVTCGASVDWLIAGRGKPPSKAAVARAIDKARVAALSVNESAA